MRCVPDLSVYVSALSCRRPMAISLPILLASLSPLSTKVKPPLDTERSPSCLVSETSARYDPFDVGLKLFKIAISNNFLVSHGDTCPGSPGMGRFDGGTSTVHTYTNFYNIFLLLVFAHI